MRGAIPEWYKLAFFCYFGSLIGFGGLGQIEVSEKKIWPEEKLLGYFWPEENLIVLPRRHRAARCRCRCPRYVAFTLQMLQSKPPLSADAG